MTVESYRAPVPNNGHPIWHDGGALWHFANFISGSSSWEIIDSWAGCTYVASPSENTIIGRYKGDPIADAQWPNWSSLGQGAGIVIQQKNQRTGYPKLQYVWQFFGNATCACVSGHSYRHDGTASFYGSIHRIGTQGDWDLDNTRPDFGTPTKASDCCRHSFGNHGLGVNLRSYYSADDDWIAFIQNRDDIKDFYNLMWIGQYNPKSAGQETVAKPAYGMLADNSNSLLSPDGGALGANQFLGEIPSVNEFFEALDENGVFREWCYTVNSGLEHFLTDSTQPNEFDSSVCIDLFEVVVRGRDSPSGYDTRLIGSLHGVYAAWRLGNGSPFDSRQFMCLGHGYGVVVEWDGVTTV